MKPFASIAILGAILAVPLLCVIDCRKQTENLDQAWTSPTKIAESLDGIIGSASLHRNENRVIALVPKIDRRAKWLIFDSQDSTNHSWVEIQVNDIPSDYFLIAIDQANERVLLGCGSEEAERLTMDVLVGTLMSGRGVQIVDQQKWVTNKKALFGETGPNVSMTIAGKSDSPLLGRGVLDGSRLFIPYCVNAETRAGNTYFYSHFDNGVFYSSDLGKSWQMERISDFYAASPRICESVF